MQSGVKAENKAGLVLKLFHHVGTSPRHEVRLVPSQMQLGRQITPENKLQKRYLIKHLICKLKISLRPCFSYLVPELLTKYYPYSFGVAGKRTPKNERTTVNSEFISIFFH